MSGYKPMFTLAGVPWTYDAQSWRFVVPKLFIGLIAAFVLRRSEPVLDNLLISLIYGLLLNLLLLLHIVGHIISSKFVSPAMTEARIMPILIQTRYDSDPEQLTSRVHLVRSIGGPLMNLLLGALGYVLWRATGSLIAQFFMAANWLLTLLILLPLPTIDGEVIWRETAKRLRGER